MTIEPFSVVISIWSFSRRKSSFMIVSGGDCPLYVSRQRGYEQAFPN